VKRAAIAILGAEIAFAGSFALAGVLGLTGHAQALSEPLEDQPGWSCVDDGNRVCGPGNANGAPAGCYDDGGVLIAVWPCTPHEGTGAAPGPLWSVPGKMGGRL
jgi:hypothetical protein